jgi:hypothetical protein
LIGFLHEGTNKCPFNFLFERIEAYLPRFFIGYWILNEAGFLSGFLFFGTWESQPHCGNTKKWKQGTLRHQSFNKKPKGTQE